MIQYIDPEPRVRGRRTYHQSPLLQRQRLNTATTFNPALADTVRDSRPHFETVAYELLLPRPRSNGSRLRPPGPLLPQRSRSSLDSAVRPREERGTRSR